MACTEWMVAHPWLALGAAIALFTIGVGIAYWQNARRPDATRRALLELQHIAQHNLNLTAITIAPAPERTSDAVVMRLAYFDRSEPGEILTVSNITGFIHEAGLLLAHCGWRVMSNATGLHAVRHESRIVLVQSQQPRAAHHAA